jgi:REP element-mobilizing transposase RayT
MSPIKKYKYRRNLPHVQKSDRTLFATFVTKDRRVLSKAARDIVFSACLHYHGTKVNLHAAVVMPDHVHIIFGLLRDENKEEYSLAEVLGSIKSFTSHAINKLENTKGHVWLDESFDHVWRHDEALNQKIEYLRQNPVRRGLVRRPEEYKWLWVRPAQPGRLCHTDRGIASKGVDEC